MKQLDLYEFAGLVVPGAVVLTGIVILTPGLGLEAFTKMGAGELGLGLVLAYAAGHLVQAVGNVLESAWWILRGGWPTERIAAKGGQFLNKAQIDSLHRQVARVLEIEEPVDLRKANSTSLSRLIYAAVSRAGQAGRIDIFNAQFGLCRGLAASFLVVMAMVLTRPGWSHWTGMSWLLAGFLASGYRANRFAHHYAKELYVQFLQLAPKETR